MISTVTGLKLGALLASVVVPGAIAEMHTVQFDNTYGFGTPTLVQGSTVLSVGASVTVNGPLISAFAYLQTGACGFNGEGCTVVETTLRNPTTPGNGSSTGIVSLPPQSTSASIGFHYFGGCDGVGTNPCSSGIVCPTTFLTCQADNVNLAITFCV